MGEYDFEHNHPHQDEPRSHGETHHEKRDVDINSAPREVLMDMPMIDDTRADLLMENRPFKDWSEIREIEGFSYGLVDDLMSGGGRLG